MTQTCWTEWKEQSNKGEGYEVGHETDTPYQAAKREGYEIIYVDNIGSVLAKDNDKLVVICDLHGPWACVVTTELCQ